MHILLHSPCAPPASDACASPLAESLNEVSKVENADPTAIMSVQFSPNGKTIISGGYSGTIKVWDLRPFVDSEWEHVTEIGEDEEGEWEETFWRNSVTGDEYDEKPCLG